MPPDDPPASPSALQPSNVDSAFANPPPNVARQTSSNEVPDNSDPPANGNDSTHPGAATSSVLPANQEPPLNTTGLDIESAEGGQDAQDTSNIEQQRPLYVDQAEMRKANNPGAKKTRKGAKPPLVEATSIEDTPAGPTPAEATLTEATSTEDTLAGPTPAEATPTEVMQAEPMPAGTIPPKKKGNQRGGKKRKADEASLEPRDGARRSTRIRSGAPAPQ